MEFEFKDKVYRFPVVLSDTTLGQRVGFYNQYGKDLDERAADIEKMADGLIKQMETTMWHMDNAMKTFSWYTGIPLGEAQATISVADIMTIYNVDLALLQEQEQAITHQATYDWNGETWVLAAPELSPESKMTLIEFITGKEIVRQMDSLGKGKWDALPYLCAVYLRKEGEPFTEDLVSEHSERVRLMERLPLDIALGVAFFLSSTLHIYTNTSAFSGKERAGASAQPATLSDGDGSRFSAT